MRTGEQFLATAFARSEGGYSLLELGFAMALTGLLCLAVMQATGLVHNNTPTLAQSRDQLMIAMRQNAANLGAIRVSLRKAENTQLLKCVCGGGCTTGQVGDFTLYDATGSKPQSPTYYDAAGFACDPASPSCFIKVTTNFSADCMPALPSANPTPPLNCATPAEFVEVVFSIEQNPATLAKGNLINKITASTLAQVTDIAPAGAGVCP